MKFSFEQLKLNIDEDISRGEIRNVLMFFCFFFWERSEYKTILVGVEMLLFTYSWELISVGEIMIKIMLKNLCEWII